MSTGGPGGVKGTGQIPQITVTDPSGKEVDLEGKTTTGSKVTKESAPGTPIQTGAKAKDPSETKKLLADFDVRVEEWDDEDEADVMFDAVDDMTKAESLPEDMRELQTAALKDAGVLFEDALSPEDLEVSTQTLTSSSKILAKVTEFKEKLTTAWATFVNKFRPSSETANAMANGVGQLVDISTDGNEANGQEVEEIATQLQSNPSAVLQSMEEKGLHQVVGEIKDTIKVANTKNLGVIKQTLSDHSESFPALRGMSPKARNIMINGALIAARIGNAGKGSDVVHLESRGYIIGKMPPEKMRLVETVLSMEPEQAIAKLEEWHEGAGNASGRTKTGTNFKKALREVAAEEALDGVGSLFGGNEVEVDQNPAPRQVNKEVTERNMAVHEQKKGASRKTLDARDRVLDDIRDPSKTKLKPASERNLEGLSEMFDEGEVKGTPVSPVQTDEQATKISQMKRERARANKMTVEKQEKLEQELAGLVHAKERVLKDGLTDLIAKEMKGVEDSLVAGMQKAGASKEEAGLLANGVMVRLHLAAWTDEDSSSEVTHLGAVSLEEEYGNAKEAAGKLAEQDLATVKDLLLRTPSVVSTDFEYALGELETARMTSTWIQ